VNASAVLITRERAWPSDARVDYPFGDVQIATDCPNVFRRFELAAAAQSDTVYVQDDDIVTNIQRLAAHYDGRLTCVMPLGFQEIYAGTGVTMVGFGCFFPRRMAEHFVKHQQFWREHFGDDIVDTEADRFFTFSNQPCQQVDQGVRQIARPIRMSARPNHYAIRSELFRRLRTLGSHP
jgi:hypothetical protein